MTPTLYAIIIQLRRYFLICFQSQMPRRAKSMSTTSHVMVPKVPHPPIADQPLPYPIMKVV